MGYLPVPRGSDSFLSGGRRKEEGGIAALPQFSDERPVVTCSMLSMYLLSILNMPLKHSPIPRQIP